MGNNNLFELNEVLMKLLEPLIDRKVNERFDELIGQRLVQAEVLNTTLTRNDLCKRWGCSRNTLSKYEKKGFITPLPVKGKKRVYLMKDIVEVESRGITSVFRSSTKNDYSGRIAV